MRADATLRFDLEGHLEGNIGQTMFSFDIHVKDRHQWLGRELR